MGKRFTKYELESATRTGSFYDLLLAKRRVQLLGRLERTLTYAAHSVTSRLDNYLCHHYGLTEQHQHRWWETEDLRQGSVEVARNKMDVFGLDGLLEQVLAFFNNKADAGEQYTIEPVTQDEDHRNLIVVNERGERTLVILFQSDSSYTVTLWPLSE
jgi:hypothetical protein